MRVPSAYPFSADNRLKELQKDDDDSSPWLMPRFSQPTLRSLGCTRGTLHAYATAVGVPTPCARGRGWWGADYLHLYRGRNAPVRAHQFIDWDAFAAR